MAKLNRNESNWSFEERRKINENWEILERESNKVASGNNGLRQEVDDLRVSVDQNRTRINQVNLTANQAKENANSVLGVANEANRKSDEATEVANNAKNIANEAERKSDYTQSQLDNIVADGNSTAEVVQARGNQVTLNARLNLERDELRNDLTGLSNRQNLTSQELLDSRVDSLNSQNFNSLPERLNVQYNDLNTRLNQNFTDKHPIVKALLADKYIIAHRALSNVYPENTLPAFYECYKRGIKFFETDFRKTADGFWVCHHDATTLRATGVNLNIANSNLAQIRELRNTELKNSALYGNPIIPTIEEIFQFIKNTNSIVNINFDYGILDSDIPTIVNLLYSYGIQNNVICPGPRWHLVDPTLCISNGDGIGRNEQNFIDAGRNGNTIASYDYAYAPDINGINIVSNYGSKYNVPIVVYTAETYQAFRQVDATRVNAIQVDNLWYRGAF